MGAFAFIASRPRARGTILAVLGGITLVAVAGAGVAGAAKGERDLEKKGEGPPVIAVVAKNTQFNKTQLQVPGGEKFTLHFSNEDAGIYHDVSVYTQAGKPVVAGEPVVGVGQKKYDW